MAESIDIPIPSNMLESMGMFAAAQKNLLEEMRELKKNIKILEREGKVVPPDIQDRMARLEQDRVRIQAKQAAKVAAEESTKHVREEFSKFSENIHKIKETVLEGPSMGSIARSAERQVMSGLVDAIGGKLTFLNKTLGETRAAEVIKNMATKVVGQGAASKLGAVSRTTGLSGLSIGMAGRAAGIAGIVAAPMLQYIEQSTEANRMQTEINKREYEFQSELFTETQDLVGTSQRSSHEVAAMYESIGKAREVGTDWFSPGEVIAGLKAKNFAVDALKALFGQTGQKAQAARGQERAIQEKKHHELARQLGKGWEEASNAENMARNARSNPSSVVSLKYARAHSLYGSGSFLSYMRGVVGPGATDEELRTLAYKHQDEMMATIEKVRAAEEKAVKKNPSWRVNEHERGVWIDEVGKHRYERTLAWVKS